MSLPGAGPSATSTLGAGGAQDLGDLHRGEHRIDGIGDARGLRAEQRAEGLRHERQQDADHVARPDAEGVERVRRLRRPRDEGAMRDRQRRLAGVGAAQEAKRRRLGSSAAPAERRSARGPDRCA
jgi:hypothetical protein